MLDADEQGDTVDAIFDLIREDALIYNRGGGLVLLSGEQMDEVDEFKLADYLARRVRFRKMREGAPVKTAPPAWLCKRIVKLRANLPELLGIITAPTLRPDGSLLNEPGFDTGNRPAASPWRVSACAAAPVERGA